MNEHVIRNFTQENFINTVPLKQGIVAESDSSYEYEYSDETDLYSEPEDVLTDLDRSNLDNITEVSYLAEYTIQNSLREELTCVFSCQSFQEVQKTINLRMRNIVVEWMHSIHYYGNFSSVSLYSSIFMFDYFLSQNEVPRNELQLVGVTCLMLATKFGEVKHPGLRYLLGLCNDTYSHQQYQEYEQKIITFLDFNLQRPHPRIYLHRLLESIESDQALEECAYFIAETSILSYRFHVYRPSVIAAASVLLAAEGMKREINTAKMLLYAHSTQSVVNECSIDLRESAIYALDKKPLFTQKYPNAKRDLCFS